MDIVHAIENAKAKSDRPVEDVKIAASGEVSFLITNSEILS